MKPQQSPLDEILARLHELHFSTGEDDDYKPMTREEAKKLIKSLFLEIVGEDEPRPDGNGSSAVVRRAISKNELRAELRARIREL
jgi:hypothetical protein